MLETEILEIIDDPPDDGSRLNAIADEFRRGREMSEILCLLDSNHAELVAIGAWLLGELHFRFYGSNEFLSRLQIRMRAEAAAGRLGIASNGPYSDRFSIHD